MPRSSQNSRGCSPSRAAHFKIPCRVISTSRIARAPGVFSLVPGRDTGAQGDIGFEVGRAWGPRGTRPWWSDVAGAFRGQTLVNPPHSHYTLPSALWCFTRSPDWLSGGDWYGSFSAPAHAENGRHEVEGGYERGPLRLRAEQIEACDGRLERRGGCALPRPGGSPRAASRWRARTG
jgi:hypothetical protein